METKKVKCVYVRHFLSHSTPITLHHHPSDVEGVLADIQNKSYDHPTDHRVIEADQTLLGPNTWPANGEHDVTILKEIFGLRGPTPSER